MNFTFQFDVGLAFWDVSETPQLAKQPQRKYEAGERVFRNFPHASRHETSQFSLTSFCHSRMSLKHYSERSSLRENAKQVSEFSITSHRQVASKVQTLRYDARRRKVIRHSWSSFNKNKSKTQPQPTSSMPLGFWPFTEHEKLPQKYRHSNTTPARAK